MSQIVAILNYEEGYRESPYIDTRGFPTVGCGIKIGPKGAALSSYIFRIPRAVGDVWMRALLNGKTDQMKQRPLIGAALEQCNDARADILCSMAYQMGVEGLANFRNMLQLVGQQQFSEASEAMLNSLWANQTPQRARRHAEVMRSGSYDAYRGLL